MTKIIASILIMGIVFSGCMNTFQREINNSNEYKRNNFQPYQYVMSKNDTKSTWYATTKLLGKKGKSIASDSKLLTSDVFNAIEKNCGFVKSDLIETRIVYHENPIYFEVWVFKDEKSEMKDKRTAFGIKLKQIPNGAGVDIFISGECHAKPSYMIFGK